VDNIIWVQTSPKQISGEQLNHFRELNYPFLGFLLKTLPISYMLFRPKEVHGALSLSLVPPPRKAQFSIFTRKLIAVDACFAKAVEVAFFKLFPMNDMGNELRKAGMTKRGGEIIRPPGNDGIFFPLIAAFDAFYAQFSFFVLHKLELLRLILRDIRLFGSR
jgi:hypothetical protein